MVDDQVDFDALYDKFCKTMGLKGGHDTWDALNSELEFNIFIGIKLRDLFLILSGLSNRDDLRKEITERAKLFSGPNSNTLLAVYKARRHGLLQVIKAPFAKTAQTVVIGASYISVLFQHLISVI